MRKGIILAAIAAIVVIGAVLLFHKSTKPAAQTVSASANTSTQASANNAVVVTKNNASVGNYLADPSGRTLYTYDKDSNGVSNCSGACLAAWPAYQDKGSTSNLPDGVSTIKRTDNGQVQYTYMGKPLYYFVSDSPGQVTGNGVQNFTVAKASPASAQSSAKPSTPAASSQSNYSY